MKGCRKGRGEEDWARQAWTEGSGLRAPAASKLKQTDRRVFERCGVWARNVGVAGKTPKTPAAHRG